MIDPYLDPSTGLLRNSLRITDALELKRAESAITAVAIYGLIQTPLRGSYDLAHLQSFHRRIFGRIYPWAGEIRTVSIAKTDLFCLPQHIELYSQDVFSQLAAEKHLRGLNRESFVDRLTHYFAEVNAIHPFREGNGRSQRAFFGQLTRDAGWPIDWSDLDSDENVEASIASLRGDNQPLRALLDRLTVAVAGD